MKNNLIFVLFLFLIFGCSRVQTLNTVKYTYSATPDTIIWLQVAGFSDEQLPILKFNSLSSEEKLFAEKADCAGRMWDFNLFQLRPSAANSFLSQSFGLKNITNTCTDMEQIPIWGSFQDSGYKVNIVENGTDDNNSFEKFIGCGGKNKKYVEELRLFRMAKGGNSQNSFHYQDAKDVLTNLRRPGVYFDKACQKEMCYSSMLNNTKSLFTNLQTDNDRSFYIIRDFNYQKALQKKDIIAAKEALMEIEQTLKWASSLGNALVVLTSAEPIMLEFPSQGKDWEGYVKTGKTILFKNTSLLSTVLAKGPSSENFCGMFDEADFYRRMQFKSPSKVFDWDNLNPIAH